MGLSMERSCRAMGIAQERRRRRLIKEQIPKSDGYIWVKDVPYTPEEIQANARWCLLHTNIPDWRNDPTYNLRKRP